MSQRPVQVTKCSGTRLLLLNLLLLLSTVVIYTPVRHYPFLNYDDPWYVVKNPYLHDGLNAASLRWAFLERGYCHNWHPLTWVSHGLDIQLFGFNAGAHHVVNVVLHIVCVMLLFWVLRRATGYTARSFAVAALFAVHPINVEPVAWISERKTLLSMIFFLLVFAAYRWYARRPGDGRYSLVAAFYLLGLMCKPQIIPIPILLLLWDYWPLQRMAARTGPAESAPDSLPQQPFWQLFKEKIPLFVIGLGSAIITMLAQEVGSPQKWPFTLTVRTENAIVSYARYLGKAVWPAGLSPFYPHPGNSIAVWQVLGALTLLAAISALVFVGRAHRYLVVGWLWFLIALLPMIGLIQVWEQGMADRYAYQSFIGIFIIVCWGYADCARRLRVPAAASACLLALILLTLGAVARYQTRYWANSVAVWSRSLEVTPRNNFIAQQSLGYTLTLEGRQAEAVPHITNALEMRPDDPLSNIELAMYEEGRGNLFDAILHYRRALENPSSVPTQKRLALVSLSRAYRTLGDDQAARECNAQASKIPVDDDTAP